jgi:1,2-phenylacetyl-CoA epoxidase PaaB subunit
MWNWGVYVERRGKGVDFYVVQNTAITSITFNEKGQLVVADRKGDNKHTGSSR